MARQVIPAAAVDAAAKALHFFKTGSGWEDADPATVWECMEQAESILRQAKPYMAAQTLEDAVHAFPLETIHAPDNAVVWMMRRAEELRSGR